MQLQKLILAQSKRVRLANACNINILWIRNYSYNAATASSSSSINRNLDAPTIKAENAEVISPLIRLQSATIQYPSFSSTTIRPFDLNIWPNLECGSGGGGHVVLGRNASGKTLLSHTLLQNADEDDLNPSYLQSGSISTTRRIESKNRNHHFITHVSFDSHSDLLLNPNTTTVHKALIPGGGNRLSPTAKFLSVRLGMYPMLNRYVNTLSTGEIRRVLLVRALVSKPELLILDNAFDGLDIQGREGLQDIIERVLKGFRMDILVQGVGNAKDTARTQVLLFTHRSEEIADGIGRVTYINSDGVRTEDRAERNRKELVNTLMNLKGDDGTAEKNGISHPWDIVSNADLPSDFDINTFWGHGRKKNSSAHDNVLVQAQDLQVTRDDITLLSHLNWTVQRGERWHLAGNNGSGKSTLSRILLRSSMNNILIHHDGPTKHDAIISEGSLNVTPSMVANAKLDKGGVSWVSTELHLYATHNWGNKTVLDIMRLGASFIFNADRNQHHPSNEDRVGVVDEDIAVTALNWVGLLNNHCHNASDMSNHPFLSRHFSTLSQGEQKLLLIASAIAQRPELLILDEPCQGLDLWNKGHLLALLERMCCATAMSLLYVTHHDEELIPSIGHRLLLNDGSVTYCGVT